MKFDIKNAITSIFKDKNLENKIVIVSLTTLLFYVFKFLRGYATSFLYFEDFIERISVALLTFKVNIIEGLFGFPVITPYQITFDISQLLFGKLDVSDILSIPCLLIGSIFISFTIGYFVCNSHNLILKKDNNLPEIENWKNYLKKGLACFWGCAILSLPMCFLAVEFYILIYKLMYDLPIIPTLIARGFVILTYFILFLYLAAAIIPFICDLKFKSLFKISTTFKIIFKNLKAYFKYISWQILFFTILATLVCLAYFVSNLIYKLIEFLLTLINPDIFKYIENYIYEEDFATSIIIILTTLLILPIIFWIFSILSNIQAQFAEHVIKTKENNENNSSEIE